MVSKESWIRYHLKLGPIGPLGRLALYAVAVIVALGVAWVPVSYTHLTLPTN